MNFYWRLTLVSIFFLSIFRPAFASQGIENDKAAGTISITTADGNIRLLIDYRNGCYIKSLEVKGKNTLSASGVYTGITVKDNVFTSRNLLAGPLVKVQGNSVTISGIRYGEKAMSEVWKFQLQGNEVTWDLERKYDNSFTAEDMSFPKWSFENLAVWKGGIIDNGGVIWCKYLHDNNDTYGVHTGGTTFWNEESGNGLSIQAVGLNNAKIATKYSKNDKQEFTSTQLVTNSLLKQRHHQSRFLGGRSDVFAPFTAEQGTIQSKIRISYVDYFKQYNRGDLKGINATAVRELLNTTARYGVVDNNIVGGNGWLTNWKCLHEPFFAQIALAVNDVNYTQNLVGTLDQERDLAILPDGRVLSRWHDVPGDEIKGTYNAETGYYEAMWGYTIDSQTGYVINVCELFDLTGDVSWLKTHHKSCEKALEWLIRRDSDNNGLFEMMNKNIAEGKASDWLDIVWASYENAFVNAQMYGALTKWAACEKVLGNTDSAERYTKIAQRLKEQLNKPVEAGGFWKEDKKQYVYWRDNDGSIHGDNLVTPVNFSAIAFGVCDDKDRIKAIVGQIEERTEKEKLFHWPLCFDSFRREEVSGGNWPFPNYENGDIFPTWGYLGVQSYIHYDKTLALKYIRNLLNQYEKDGLSSQRYNRVTGLGTGSDVLAGICTGITALYSDIYGIQPKWNRLVISPALVPDLNGTKFSYRLRNDVYDIELSEGAYKVSGRQGVVTASQPFGFATMPDKLSLFAGIQDTTVMEISRADKKQVSLTLKDWNAAGIKWDIKDPGKYTIRVKGLSGKHFSLYINDKKIDVNTDGDGAITINQVLTKDARFNLVVVL